MGRFDRLEIIDDDNIYRVPDPVACRLAEQLYQLFCEQRPLYAPGRVTVPRRDLIRFYRAGEYCRDHRVAPQEYIRAQLESMSRSGNFWTSQIDNPACIESETTHDTWGVQSARAYKSQLQILQKLTTLYGLRTALQDPQSRLTPLVRASAAYQGGEWEILKRYRKQALLELRSNPAASRLFDQLLPILEGASDG